MITQYTTRGWIWITRAYVSAFGLHSDTRDPDSPTRGVLSDQKDLKNWLINNPLFYTNRGVLVWKPWCIAKYITVSALHNGLCIIMDYVISAQKHISGFYGVAVRELLRFFKAIQNVGNCS